MHNRRDTVVWNGCCGGEIYCALWAGVIYRFPRAEESVVTREEPLQWQNVVFCLLGWGQP